MGRDYTFDLALVYLQHQDLSNKSPSEMVDMFEKIYDEVKKRQDEIKKNS